MTGPDTGPDSPASPADTVSGGTENGEIRLDTVQTEPAVLLPNAGHGPAELWRRDDLHFGAVPDGKPGNPTWSRAGFRVGNYESPT